jgi:hypothetical protein
MRRATRSAKGAFAFPEISLGSVIVIWRGPLAEGLFIVTESWR